MLRLAKVMLCAGALGLVAGSANAGDFDKQIELRKAHMSLVGWQMGTLSGMAKGKIPYDAKAAQAAADNMAALSTMNNGSLWPKGSDATANPDMTRAKKDAWDDYPKLQEAYKDWQAASKQMASAAGGGLDSLKGAMGDLGKSCGGCHKPFRAPKKK